MERTIDLTEDELALVVLALHREATARRYKKWHAENLRNLRDRFRELARVKVVMKD